MRWLAAIEEFESTEFTPGEFYVGNTSPDPAGIRTELLHYQPQGARVILERAIDPQGLHADVAVVTEPSGLGLVRIRDLGFPTWSPVTNDVGTTYRRTSPEDGSAWNVEIEVTIPDGRPRNILLKQVHELVGTL